MQMDVPSKTAALKLALLEQIYLFFSTRQKKKAHKLIPEYSHPLKIVDGTKDTH